MKIGKKIRAALAILAAVTTVTAATALCASAATGGLIGEAKAKEIALDHIGVKADDVTVYKTALDSDDGVRTYEIELIHGTTRYDIDVDAANGAVLGVDKKMKRAAGAASATGDIGLDKAKEKALMHAGVAADKATFTKTKLDRDDGIRYYEIEFTDDAKKYELDILASDGTVLEYSWKNRDARTAAAPAGTITADQAKEIALAHAGVAAGSAAFTKTKLDRDDGVLEYDVEFIADNMEYEYEIDAASGSILSYDVERVDR